MITKRNIRDQVALAVDATEMLAEVDVDAITAEIVQRYGRVNINNIPEDLFWGMVADHIV